MARARRTLVAATGLATLIAIAACRRPASLDSCFWENYMRRVILLFLFLATALESAFATDLITQPEASLLVAPTTLDGTYLAKIGDVSVTNPSWIIQQSAPAIFASGADYSSPPGVGWSFTGGNGRVAYYAAKPPASASPNSPPNTLEFALNGQNSNSCAELDLQAQAIPPNGYRDGNGNYAASRVGMSAPLNNISVINIQLGLVIPYETINARCGNDAGGYAFSIGLQSSTGYTILFQVALRDSMNRAANLTPCGGYPASGSKTYCFTSTASTLKTFGTNNPGPGNQAVSNARVFYNLDAYSQALNAINKTPDTDPAHWRVTAPYFTLGIVGGVASVAEWDSIKLSVY